MTTFGKTLPLFLILALLTLCPPSARSEKVGGELLYQLAISFDTDKRLLTGTSRITLPPEQPVRLRIGGLRITGILVQTEDGRNRVAKPTDQEMLIIDGDSQKRDFFISYTLEVSSSGTNRIAADGIVLIESWYPQPDRQALFQLTASLPDGFTAVAESDTFPLKKEGNTVSAALSSPLGALHFAAAPYALDQLQVRKNLRVYTLFFEEDRNLAAGYLSSARNYILRYEKEIGPFPYNHYVITSNRLPTGLGMPTFTLLGQSVLRLPFIKATSLGHEILHSWFGNAVEVDYHQGNWCEGLTSYLADHAYRRDSRDDSAYRKETIINYLSYINDDNVIPLSTFYSADHSQPLAKPRRAVGYSKSLMVFHELHEKIGSEHFGRGVQDLYGRFKGKSASWSDISTVFSTAAGTDLAPFFNERLQRIDIPSLALEDIRFGHGEHAPMLRFTLVQKTENPFSLKIPVRVTSLLGEEIHHLNISQSRTDVELELESRPLALTLDPYYSMLRQLGPEEKSAAWSRFLGSDRKLVVIGSEQEQEVYQPLLDRMADDSWVIKLGSEVTNSELGDHDLLFLGADQEHARSLFGKAAPWKGFTLDVRSNPLNNTSTATLISSASAAESTIVASRLSHYGKYSFLSFEEGRLVEKRIADTRQGQEYVLEELPAGGATAPLTGFDEVARQLSDHDVIYVGETHTSVSDHRLQLRILEGVSRYKDKLAIGMEMFPADSQDTLDRYTLGDGSMTEREFLKASRYFEVWRYDFRYFRDIFRFAKEHQVPVVGLNIDREIVSSVFKNGGTDNLSEEQKSTLPAERDLDLPGYSRRLGEMYSTHARSNLGSGLASGFIQAQAIWDETMADNIAAYLKAHPETTMIVLAGSQHTRKDSGIPPRVKRRLDVRQASVLNVLNGSQPDNLAEVADYFFLSPHMELPTLGKMGIILEEVDTGKEKYIKIDKFTPISKAPDAGLREGDAITSIDGFAIRTMEDIRIAMIDAEAGSAVSVELRRPETEEVFSASVPLIDPQSSPPHP